MSFRHTISAYRWPIFLGCILAMSVIAQGILVYVATRPSAPRPIDDYYEKGLEWDADAAVLDASQRLGWTVRMEVPSGEEYAMTAQRPVDVTILDQDGEPVTGLTGRLVAVRPADSRLDGESTLVELPHAPGSYRSLARLSAAGQWDLSIDAYRGETHFVHTERVVVAGGDMP